MDYAKEALIKHKEWGGKIEVVPTCPLKTKDDLSIAYTPGVAEPCKEISKDVSKAYDYTRKGNFVAVVTDGTAVLGLGDIGPEAGMPVMEGKAVLFKNFGGVDAIPICLATKDVDKIVETVKMIAPTFGGINLEDISGPRCFEIERRLKEELDIPVFHDDQHGTAVVSLAAVMNASKIVNKKMSDLTIVINGAGAAGVAIGKLFLKCGVKDVIMCNSKGAIYEGKDGLNPEIVEVAKITNKNKIQGGLSDVSKNADVLIGVSVAGAFTPEIIKSMAKDPIILAMANPTPEIFPEEALLAGARVMGTGRSDFKNQINNVLAFPGIFRGALDVRASDINDEMKIAAAEAIANIVTDEELNPDYIIPAPFDERVGKNVAKAVAEAAIKTGVNRI